MKLIGFLLGSMITTSVFAALPTHIKCKNIHGLTFELILTEYQEATMPIYDIVLNYKGRDAKNFGGTLTSYTREGIEVEAQDDGARKVITAGYNAKNNEGYYKEAASYGAKPLFTDTFKRCTVK